LYIGRTGAKSKNFYHHLATKYGYGAQADRIRELNATVLNVTPFASTSAERVTLIERLREMI
jgi:hypothetical protein